MTTKTKYILYSLWSIGAYIIFRIGNHTNLAIQQYVAATFQVYHGLGMYMALYIILGAYVGILFVRRWRFALNIPLLVCVFIPILFMNPIVQGYYLHMRFLSYPDSLLMSQMLGVISGCVLMVGLFGVKGSELRHDFGVNIVLPYLTKSTLFQNQP